MIRKESILTTSKEKNSFVNIDKVKISSKNVVFASSESSGIKTVDDALSDLYANGVAGGGGSGSRGLKYVEGYINQEFEDNSVGTVLSYEDGSSPDLSSIAAAILELQLGANDSVWLYNEYDDIVYLIHFDTMEKVDEDTVASFTATIEDFAEVSPSTIFYDESIRTYFVITSATEFSPLYTAVTEQSMLDEQRAGGAYSPTINLTPAHFVHILSDVSGLTFGWNLTGSSEQLAEFIPIHGRFSAATSFFPQFNRYSGSNVNLYFPASNPNIQAGHTYEYRVFHGAITWIDITPPQEESQI